VEILLNPRHEDIKAYVKLPLINVISLGQKQEKAGSFLSKFGTNFRKHKGRKEDFLISEFIHYIRHYALYYIPWKIM
jgi:hypothetical protein